MEARPNTAVLSEVLATRYTSGTETLFEGIHKLLPGHRLVFEDGRVRVQQYWDLPLEGPDPDLERLDDRALVDRFRALLQESVRLRLMADVPLGAFLSGDRQHCCRGAHGARDGSTGDKPSRSRLPIAPSASPNTRGRPRTPSARQCAKEIVLGRRFRDCRRRWRAPPAASIASLKARSANATEKVCPVGPSRAP